MKPKVSVILPVYNRSRSLAAAMRSVLDQSFRDLELIVVDDASTEDLRPVIDAVGDPRIRFIRHEQNGGASAARNTGLAVARGEFIAFQDSDDLWLPGKLEKQVAMLESLPSHVGVVTGSKILYGRGPDDSYGPGLVSIRPSPHRAIMAGEDQVRRYLIENRISLQNALFRRDCYPTLAWFDERVRANVDWAFSCSLAQHTTIAESPEPVVMAFCSVDSISKNKRLGAIALIRIMKRNRAVYEKYPREYGAMLWRIGLILAHDRKPRLARRFIFAGLRRNPALLWKQALAKARKAMARQVTSTPAAISATAASPGHART